MIEIEEIVEKLERVIVELSAQIEVVNREANERGVAAVELRTRDGNYIVAPLLVAKAGAYAALAQLQVVAHPTIILNPPKEM